MISPILSEEDISLDLATKGKQSALSKIAIRIARRNGLDEQMVLRGLFDRECLGSTGIGRGVAIPHALLGMISSPAASLTRLAQPIDFDGPDDDPVDLIYTILWPACHVRPPPCPFPNMPAASGISGSGATPTGTVIR